MAGSLRKLNLNQRNIQSKQYVSLAHNKNQTYLREYKRRLQQRQDKQLELKAASRRDEPVEGSSDEGDRASLLGPREAFWTHLTLGAGEPLPLGALTPEKLAQAAWL